MAGIKLTDLPIDNSVNATDAFLKVKNGTSYQVSGSTFINQFSGLNSALNLGTGGTVLNVSETTPTTLKFNSLSASSPIQISNNALTKTVNFSIQNNSITNSLLAPNSVNTSNIVENSISALDMGYAGAVLQVVNYTGAIRVGTNSTSFVPTGAQMTITPRRADSKILVRIGTLMGSFESWPYATVFRDNTDLTPANCVGWGGYQTDYSWRYTSNQLFFEVMDSPNTTSPVTYSLRYRNGTGGGYYTYIGVSWYLAAYATYVQVPTTITLMEIHG